MLTRPHTTRAGLALTAAALLAAGAPTGASAKPIDSRPSAEAQRMKAQERYYSSVGKRNQDLRSPDARDAAQPTKQDLRSPDARDAADPAPRVPAPAAPVRIVQATPDGFDRGDAAIGAGVAMGLVLLTAGSGFALTRRRREAHAVS
jgi:hypothetical protein